MTTRFQTQKEVIDELFKRAQALPVDSSSRKLIERELEDRYGVVTEAQAKQDADLQAGIEAIKLDAGKPRKGMAALARRAAARAAKRGDLAKAAQKLRSATILDKE